MTNPDHVLRLVHHLRAEPSETEWLEFKENNAEPERIGEYVSGLANSATILGKPYGYIVWGIRDGSREVVGTSFRPASIRVKNQPLQIWLSTMTNGQAGLEFGICEADSDVLVVARISRAIGTPLRFNGRAFVRVGEALTRLSRQPSLEARLWRALHSVSFEGLYAADGVTEGDVLKHLDIPRYIKLHGLVQPTIRSKTIQLLSDRGLIARSEAGGWSITNLAALLYAVDINRFPLLSRKALRVIRYVGNSKSEAIGERVGQIGYAAAFENMVGYIESQLPSHEVIMRALRRTETAYPTIAIRELLANTLIHQDFTVGGAGPLVEIYDGRIEFTNPGEPLVDIDRLLDSPARSRNDLLARDMRMMGICEERGSGVDKVIVATEQHQLPSPKFQVVGDATVATLFAPKDLREMDSDERIRACYMHASLRHVSHDFLTNASLRQRFKLDHSESVTASRVIKESIEAGRVKVYDPTVGNRARKYSPYWA